MEDWALIRRLAADGVAKAEIARKLGISRTTVLKAIASEMMALGEIPQGRSSNFPTLGGCHCSGRRVPVAA